MNKQIKEKVEALVRTYGLFPNDKLGQNFLVDETVVEKAVLIAELNKADLVLEVGPGLGILTEELLKAAKKVYSIELDKKLAEFLKAKFVNEQHLILINQDALQFNPALIGGAYKIVANIPYQITSRFFKTFLTSINRPESITVLVQKEVAERICAKAGSHSLLSLSVQLYGKPKIVEYVSRDKFWPSPKVDSALLHISEIIDDNLLARKLQGILEKDFWRVLKIGFSAKRKQLHHNLASGLKLESKEIKQKLRDLGISEITRAQNLTLEQWIELILRLEV